MVVGVVVGVTVGVPVGVTDGVTVGVPVGVVVGVSVGVSVGVGVGVSVGVSVGVGHGSQFEPFQQSPEGQPKIGVSVGVGEGTGVHTPQSSQQLAASSLFDESQLPSTMKQLCPIADSANTPMKTNIQSGKTMRGNTLLIREVHPSN